MKLAIHNPSFTYAGGAERIAADLAATARAAEEGGAEQFTLMDHWFQIPPVGPRQEPMLEGYTALGYVAAQTERIRLGLLVTGVTYRHPGLLAKTVTTLDVLSGGRAQLGLGAAWFEQEHDGLGVPYPRSPSASSGWRRRSRSACRCGARTTGPTAASITSWPKRSAPPDRSRTRTPAC
ncbi:MAG: LLM class flavin-dependent oxidoreductase [Solirubrobacterales bacterium]